MAILSVTQGLVEVEGGKVFELDSSKGLTWLESIKSFRYEPTGQNKPYTARKETGKGGDYWYGYRKQDGKLHKKYIGKSSEVYTGKLEEIAEALNTPTQPKVTEKAVDKVAEKVTDNSFADRLAVLESVVEKLQQSLEELKNSLPIKIVVPADASLVQDDSHIKVTDNELQNKLHKDLEEKLREELQNELHTSIGNLQAENERLGQECQGLRSQLEQERADREAVETQVSDLKRKVMSASENLPEAEIILSRLRGKRQYKHRYSRGKLELEDVEALLEMIEEFWGHDQGN